MQKQTYLIRKGAKYHFRRRMPSTQGNRPITVPLGTANPSEARRLARRLAVKWDDIAMQNMTVADRGTLTISEQELLYRRGL